MPQTRSKKPSPKDISYFSDDSPSISTPKHQNKYPSPLRIFNQDSAQSPKDSTSIIHHKPHTELKQLQVKQQFHDQISSSFMDLEDIISSPHQNFNPQAYYDSDDSQSEKPEKSKRIKKNLKNSGSALIPIKIQDQEDFYAEQKQKQSRYKGNRKIRTTINEEKIKIMEYLFQFVANQEPYKGTILSLKDVGKIVDLGYSTILHKYRDYREKGEIEKGLLLKCKNFKRKYNKSVILETYIKRALKQSEFKTAKQLAAFISENYKINANRSIISRHLNQMQRDKTKAQDKFVRVPGLRKHVFVDGETLKKLKQFCLVYLGLKSQKIQFNYLTVIRVYFMDNKVQLSLDKNYSNYGIIDFIITATETQLKEYYANFKDYTEVLLERKPSSLDELAYKALYSHLEVTVQNHYLDISFENEEKVFILYPYKNGSKQSDYRFKILEQLMNKRISILTVPPHFSVQNLNFIKQWFEKDVISSIMEEEFQSLIDCKDNLMTMLTQKQISLKNFANQMETSIKNF